MTYRYTSADKQTIEVVGERRFIPAAPGNRDYDDLVKAGTVIADYVPPPPPAQVPSAVETLVDALAAEGVIPVGKVTAIKARLRP